MSGANEKLQSVREEVQALVARREILERDSREACPVPILTIRPTEEMIADLKKLPTLLENITFNELGSTK